MQTKMKSRGHSFHFSYLRVMIDTILRLFRRKAPPPVPAPVEIRAALARLEVEAAEVNTALRQAFDLRRAALIAGNDAEVDRLDAVIDQLSREQERGEVLERELLSRATTLPETIP